MNAEHRPGALIAGLMAPTAPVSAPAPCAPLPPVDPSAWKVAKEIAERCDASTDEQAIQLWLNVHAAASKETRRAYEREARRLLAWVMAQRRSDGQLVEEAREPLLPLVGTKEAAQFVHWLALPASREPIPADLLARAGLGPRQPVKNGLGTVSRTQAVVILSSLYGHLATLRAPWGGYAGANPFAVLKGSVKRGLLPSAPDAVSGGLGKLAVAQRAAPEVNPRGKALPRELWLEVLATVELMPKETPKEQAHYWQTWWIMRLLWHSVFRRFEVVSAMMCDVYHTGLGYSLRVVGKGNKAASILMSKQFVDDLMTYREKLGMQGMPAADELGPLVVHTSRLRRRAGEHLSQATLFRRVKDVFRDTATRLKERGAAAADIMRLNEASVHALRHTGITHRLDAGVSMRTTSKLARHKSISTTALYDGGNELQERQQLNDGDGRQELGGQPGGADLTHQPNHPDHLGASVWPLTSR